MTTTAAAAEPRPIPAAARLAALLLAAGGVPAPAQGVTCPGAVNVTGLGRAALTNAQWNLAGDPAAEVETDGRQVVAHLKGRTYLSLACVEGTYANTRYLPFQLLGKKFQYTTDLSGAGCGCNAALYLVSMPQNDDASECSDHYCDANSVCGVACAEIDLQEANLHSWHSTIHASGDGGGVALGYGGGAGFNGPRDWTELEYGPGASCIDTLKPFQVEVSFPLDVSGGLQSMEVSLSQGAGPCRISASVGAAYSGLAEVSQALAAGMTPVISYWSSDQMLWMDGVGADHKGACLKDHADECPDTVRFYDFNVEPLDGVEMLQPSPPAHTSSDAGDIIFDDVSETMEAKEISTAAPATSNAQTYEFVGFAAPEHARSLCGVGMEMAMPKTEVERQALVSAVQNSIRVGNMSTEWPRNVIWLGGRWSQEHLMWKWYDGTPIDVSSLAWAEGQPSSFGQQSEEPWLCLFPDGRMHDTGGQYRGTLFEFGVMCQRISSSATEDEEQDYCCLAGSSCSACTRRYDPRSWCGRSRGNCELCGREMQTRWCGAGARSPRAEAHIFMQKQSMQPSLRQALHGFDRGLVSTTALGLAAAGVAALVLLLARAKVRLATTRQLGSATGEHIEDHPPVAYSSLVALGIVDAATSP